MANNTSISWLKQNKTKTLRLSIARVCLVLRWLCLIWKIDQCQNIIGRIIDKKAANHKDNVSRVSITLQGNRQDYFCTENNSSSIPEPNYIEYELFIHSTTPLIWQ